MKMKKLYEADRKRLMEYVEKEPEINLFFIGDIENYGMESDTVSVYALADGEEWDCVLLQYFDMYLIYSQKLCFRAEAVAEFLRGRKLDSLSGKTELIRQLQPYYPELTLKETYLCSYTQAEEAAAGPETIRDFHAEGRLPEGDVEIRPIKAEECPEIVDLYLQIEEFEYSHKHPEDALKTLQADFDSGEMAVGAFENGRLAAIARTSGSNTASAMLVGVATRPGFRRKGYATLVVQELCRSAFEAGKQYLCLFYDNPEAGKIYHRIGFKETGFYAMLR